MARGTTRQVQPTVHGWIPVLGSHRVAFKKLSPSGAWEYWYPTPEQIAKMNLTAVSKIQSRDAQRVAGREATKVTNKMQGGHKYDTRALNELRNKQRKKFSLDGKTTLAGSDTALSVTPHKGDGEDTATKVPPHGGGIAGPKQVGVTPTAGGQQMPYPSEHAARVADPKSFIKDTFRRKQIAPGVSLILGKKSPNGPMEPQAYRFSKTKFTAEQAKEWLKQHKVKYISFEPAREAKSASYWDIWCK